MILQKRSTTKKNDPGKLTTTVSGHVASAQNYLEAAVRETLEETGVEVEASDLVDMGVVRADYVQGDYLSNAMRGLFGYEFSGNVSDLKVENGDGAGFVGLPIEVLEKQLDTEPERFATVLTDTVDKGLVQKIKERLDAS
ncbi:NUDIX domain-containing protein [Candidatus Saccharibacteria bacterium]|nr:NUDIX domain-containing protein [Candidatus Saccharibacteria bacterium]